MTIDIQFVKMPASEALTTYINDKLLPLERKYDWLIRAQVYIKKTNSHTKNNCQVEVELSAPGSRIFASAISHNYEIAVKETIKELEHQLKKRKHILTPHAS